MKAIQQKLHIAQILAWADSFHDRTGGWPHWETGRIGRHVPFTWQAIDRALIQGDLGLSSGQSLAGLLAEKRDAPLQKLDLSIKEILYWADRHYRLNGNWPKRDSGIVLSAPEETWGGIDAALKVGRRGLAMLLEKHRGVRNHHNVPQLTV